MTKALLFTAIASPTSKRYHKFKNIISFKWHKSEEANEGGKQGKILLFLIRMTACRRDPRNLNYGSMSHHKKIHSHRLAASRRSIYFRLHFWMQSKCKFCASWLCIHSSDFFSRQYFQHGCISFSVLVYSCWLWIHKQTRKRGKMLFCLCSLNCAMLRRSKVFRFGSIMRNDMHSFAS